jgi:hypothetical protein
MKIFKKGSMMQEHHKQSSEREDERQLESATCIFSHFEMFQKFKGVDINVVARWHTCIYILKVANRS